MDGGIVYRVAAYPLMAGCCTASPLIPTFSPLPVYNTMHLHGQAERA